MHRLRGHVGRIAPSPACGLHEQRKQPLGRAEVAAEQRAIGLHRGHQSDAPKVVPLGDHLRAHQHIHLARVHLRQLRLQRTLGLGGVGVDAGNARRCAVGPQHFGQQGAQLFFELLGAPAHGVDVGAATGGAVVGNAHGVAAVVAAQGAVGLVEDLVRAAVRAVAFPAAVHAVQHGGVAPAVQQHHALLAARHAFGDGLQQRRAEHRAPRLLVHVHPAHTRQGAGTNAAGHVQPHIAAAFGVVGRRGAAGVPALQRRRGRAQNAPWRPARARARWPDRGPSSERPLAACSWGRAPHRPR